MLLISFLTRAREPVYDDEAGRAEPELVPGYRRLSERASSRSERVRRLRQVAVPALPRSIPRGHAPAAFHVGGRFHRLAPRNERASTIGAVRPLAEQLSKAEADCDEQR